MKIHAEPKPLTGPLRGGSQGATVAVEPLKSADLQTPAALLERPGGHFETLKVLGIGTPRSKWRWVPVPAFLITHPTAGPVLVDTGLHPSIVAKPRENLGRLMANASRPRMEPGEDVPARLRARGLDAKRIPVVVMTHMHFDHTSAISEFPGATFVVAEQEWVAATTDRRPMLQGYNRAHFDFTFDYRTLDYGGEGVSSYGSFGRTYDLLGDGSIRLAFTPGHSAGHQCVIARLRDRDLVIAGDSVYNLRQLDGAPEPPRPADRHNWRRSMRELHLFRTQYPQALIIPSHDAELWPTLEARYE
jgi:glyoxylase-like metal-dependent hydrolase (beta-lactamase superfamily II)